MSHTQGGHESILTPLTRTEECIETAQALAKALYARLFLSLVGQINMAICPAEGKWLSLGVLDIYGFEIFEASAASAVGLVRLGSLGSQ